MAARSRRWPREGRVEPDEDFHAARRWAGAMPRVPQRSRQRILSPLPAARRSSAGSLIDAAGVDPRTDHDQRPPRLLSEIRKSQYSGRVGARRLASSTGAQRRRATSSEGELLFEALPCRWPGSGNHSAGPWAPRPSDRKEGPSMVGGASICITLAVGLASKGACAARRERCLGERAGAEPLRGDLPPLGAASLATAGGVGARGRRDPLAPASSAIAESGNNSGRQPGRQHCVGSGKPSPAVVADGRAALPLIEQALVSCVLDSSPGSG